MTNISDVDDIYILTKEVIAKLECDHNQLNLLNNKIMELDNNIININKNEKIKTDELNNIYKTLVNLENEIPNFKVTDYNGTDATIQIETPTYNAIDTILDSIVDRKYENQLNEAWNIKKENIRALIKSKQEKMETSKKYNQTLIESTNQIHNQIESLISKEKVLNERIARLDAEYIDLQKVETSIEEEHQIKSDEFEQRKAIVDKLKEKYDSIVKENALVEDYNKKLGNKLTELGGNDNRVLKNQRVNTKHSTSFVSRQLSSNKNSRYLSE